MVLKSGAVLGQIAMPAVAADAQLCGDEVHHVLGSLMGLFDEAAQEADGANLDGVPQPRPLGAHPVNVGPVVGRRSEETLQLLVGDLLRKLAVTTGLDLA